MSEPAKRTQYLNLRLKKSEIIQWRASARLAQKRGMQATANLSEWLRAAARERLQLVRSGGAAATKASTKREPKNRVVTGEQRELPFVTPPRRRSKTTTSNPIQKE